MAKREENLIIKLVALGLAQKEARVYVALLELGRGTASEVARKATINRSTSYVILDALVHQGLVRISGKEPKQEYVAESPEKLITLFEKRIEDNRSGILQTKGILPELNSVHKIGDRPEVKFYEGTEGLKEVYEDTLTAKEEIRAYAAYEDLYSALPEYFPRYFERRAAKGIHARAILPKTPMALERRKKDIEEERTSILLPSATFGLHPEINIYDDKVMIASWREKLGIIIKSSEIADAMKKIYELAWERAKQIDQGK